MSFSDLPTSVPNKPVAYLCQEYCECEILKESPTVDEPDRRLVNWEKWLERRKEMHKTLGEALERDAGDLLMNAYEDYRCTKEEKLVFDYTNIEYPPDSQRGCPSFWKLPTCLPNKCNYKCRTEYVVTVPKEERCEIPEIEYTRVPIDIKKLKGVVPKSREGYHVWSKSVYRHEQFIKLANQIALIEPHKPDIENLIVQGTPFLKPKKSISRFESEENLDTQKKSEEVKTKALFVVNYIVLFEGQVGSIRPKLLYEYNISSNRIKQKQIKLENLTDMALRYRFVERKKENLFQDLHKEELTYNQVFFYDKNEQIILPEEILFFPFWFKTNEPRSYTANFELKLTPNILPNLEIIFNVTACADFEGKDLQCLEIKEYINNAVRGNQIQRALHKKKKQEPIVFMYNKKDIFEAVNSHFDPYNKQVQYLYDKEVVDQLEQFFEKIRLPTHPTVWNLNLYDLRAMTKERELVDSEIYKVKVVEEFYDELERDRVEALKVCEEKPTCDQVEEKPTKKEKAAKKGKGKKKEEPEAITFPPITKKYERTEPAIKYSKELEELINKLEIPCLQPNLDQEKYDTVYCILEAHFDHLCREIEQLKDRFGITEIGVYPDLPVKTYDNPRIDMAMKNETYRENLAKVGFYPPKGHTKRPEYLDEITCDNYVKKYKLYFGIPDDEPESGKKKKGKGKGKGKKGKKDKSSGKSSKKGKKGKKGKKEKKEEGPKKETCDYLEPKLSKVIDPYKTDESFVPFGEFPDPADVKEKEMKQLEEESLDLSAEFLEEEEVLLPNSIIQQYRYNLYLLFYTALENIVNAVGEYLDSVKPVLAPQYIQIIEDCKQCGMHYKHKKVKNLNLIDLRYTLSLEEFTSPCFHRATNPYEVKIQKNEKIYGTDPADQLESLYSILQNYQSEPIEDKPISYPKKVCTARDKNALYYVPTFEKFTETPDGIVDPNWSYYHDVGEQVDEKLRLSTKLLKKVKEEPPKEEIAIEEVAGEFGEEAELEEEIEDKKSKGRRKKQRRGATDGSLGYLPQFCSENDQFYVSPDSDSANLDEDVSVFTDLG